MRKRGKFNNRISIYDGHKFMSNKELERYKVLKLLEKSKEIKNLELQVKYVFEQNKVKICSYIADFRYIKNGVKIVEDVKGYKTAMYRLKKKMMKAFYGIDIFET